MIRLTESDFSRGALNDTSDTFNSCRGLVYLDRTALELAFLGELLTTFPVMGLLAGLIGDRSLNLELLMLDWLAPKCLVLDLTTLLL